MKLKINIDNKNTDEKIRLYQNVDYTLFSDISTIYITTDIEGQNLYHLCGNNGLTEVYLNINNDMMKDKIFIHSNNKIYNVELVILDLTLYNTIEDVIPAFLKDEYPLFVKLIEYYFFYIGHDFNPSDFIHSMEKYADIDETFDEFKNSIYYEYLNNFKDIDIAANKELLSKYIIHFYNNRGTEKSIIFFLRILFNETAIITKKRNDILIASDKTRGILNSKNIVLQDNYLNQLYSYIINISDHYFYEYKDLLYKLINPSGYLPFGNIIKLGDVITFENGTYNINAE